MTHVALALRRTAYEPRAPGAAEVQLNDVATGDRQQEVVAAKRVRQVGRIRGSRRQRTQYRTRNNPSLISDDPAALTEPSQQEFVTA